VIRAFDPKIWIIGDTGNLSWIRPIVNDPATANLVDALVVHNVGEDAKWTVPFKEADGGKPHFQNEYEYLEGPASPARCLNTVESIMNWFQLAGAPTWFWIHALKPIGNSEASGYSLGFWRPPDDTDPADDAKFPGLLPGHWTWNKYNWNAVGSFVRHMPWDCQVVQMDEDVHDPDLRVLAFKRPNGKLTVALSNRSFGGHVFHIDTGLTGATFKGYRYTPDDAGENCMGTDRGMLTGGTISPNVDDMSWEFWEQE